jgi:DNA-binding NtrC family response regulator
VGSKGEKPIKQRILVIEDEPSFRFGLKEYLKRKGYEVLEADTLASAEALLYRTNPPLILLDVNLPDGNGIEWLPSIRKEFPENFILVYTGRGDISTAVQAIKQGADHFLLKPFSPVDLDPLLEKGVELKLLKKEHRGRGKEKREFRIFLGSSPAIQKILPLIELAKESDTPALLLGETGTGKGMIARYIHENSQRKKGHFVELNCSLLRGELLQSELFGHKKGAFTSALDDRAGLIEYAHEGTLFLDEIGDMELPTQGHLLKVLEEKRFRRLGENQERYSDFRLISATNKELSKSVMERTFRLDLLFRIQTISITLPPLRERKEDIPELIYFFLKEMGKEEMEVDGKVIDLLKNYSFPGNIRELRNLLERAILLARGGKIQQEHFPDLSSPSSSVTRFYGRSLKEIELQIIEEAVRRHGGNMESARKELGISRATLYRKWKEILKRKKGEEN